MFDWVLNATLRINQGKPLTISAKDSILNVGLGSEYAPEQDSCSNF